MLEAHPRRETGHAGRRAQIVDVDDIRPGDWMADCGRLRLVVTVENTGDVLRSGALVHFADYAGGSRFASLTVPPGVKVTVWRPVAALRGPAHV